MSTLLHLMSFATGAGIVGKGTLLLIIGWCGAASLRRAPALARHVLWLTVIVGVLLVPVLARLTSLRVEVLPSVDRAPAVAAQGSDARADVAGPTPSTLPTAGGSHENSASPATRLRAPSIGSVTLGVWLVFAFVLAAWQVAGMLAVRRIRRRGFAVTSPEWTGPLGDAARQLRIARTPRLVMSDQVDMAFTCDVFAPTIIIPVSADEWSNDRRRAVLLHELAHVRRRDLVAHTIAGVACAIYWFHPLVWAAARRLRVESELASDDVVLDSGIRPSAYAQHLLDMVTGLGQRAPSVALAMARPKEFEGRLVAILDRSNRRTAIGRAQVGATVALLGLLTVSIAAVVPVPRRNVLSPIVSTDSMLMPSSPSPRVAQRGVIEAAPKRIALTRTTVASLLQYGTSGIINPMLMILGYADSLRLTGAQADSIAMLNRAYMIELSRIWSPVGKYYAAHLDPDDSEVPDASFARAPERSMDLLIQIVPRIEGVLSDEQRGRLLRSVTQYLDPQNLSAIGAGQSSEPAGVFARGYGFPSGPGGRRGGGGRVGRGRGQ